jgi:1,2-diacylglycerol 3-alpha-glucosyltransferase
VGRLVIEKSIHVLIKSFARILKEAPDTSLFIIGDGVYRDELIALCNKLGISDNVVFAGEIKQAQLLTRGYFQVGDVFATASVTEVQPITLLEAMYFGLPLVGVDKRGVGEMVDKAGLLCAADDEESLGKNMLKVLIDPVLKKKLHENSLYYYKKRYAWYTVVEQYETVYKKLITSYLKL